jgi:hypothetical protein
MLLASLLGTGSAREVVALVIIEEVAGLVEEAGELVVAPPLQAIGNEPKPTRMNTNIDLQSLFPAILYLRSGVPFS